MLFWSIDKQITLDCEIKDKNYQLLLLFFVDAAKNKNVGHSSYREEICA